MSDTTLVRVVHVAEDCTVPYDSRSDGRYVVALKKGDQIRISRKRKTVDPNEIARRLDEGEQVYCGAVDCPGYTFEPDELPHYDPRRPNVCMADVRRTEQFVRSREQKTIVVEVESLVEE